VTGGVVFFKLSKLLNQEDALSAPCLQHFRNQCGAIARTTNRRLVIGERLSIGLRVRSYLIALRGF
jgi:hypothetical protein